MVVFFSGCTSLPDVDQLVEEEVEKRLEKLKVQKRKECWEFIFWDAGRKVDSVMYREIGNTLKKPLDVPGRPMRPDDSLLYVVELDTDQVKDFLPDSIRLDSLDRD
jgi:hypothetical protein